MAAPFASFSIGSSGPAVGAFAITPADGADMAHHIRQLTIGGVAGAVVYDGWDGVTYTTGSLPVGTYPMCAKRIRFTGTTATVMTGWL